MEECRVDYLEEKRGSPGTFGEALITSFPCVLGLRIYLITFCFPETKILYMPDWPRTREPPAPKEGRHVPPLDPSWYLST